MRERMAVSSEAEALQKERGVVFVDEVPEIDYGEYPPVNFGGKRYRGNRRSHTRGVGIVAFFRDSWKKTLRG